MSKPKHNYSQYSNPKQKPANSAAPAIQTARVEPTKPVVKLDTAIKMVEETVETVALPKTVEGIVAGCAKLNVRVEPSIAAEVVCVLDAMSEIEIDVDKSTNDWFKICTATGIEGYCMRRFVEAHL